MRYLALLTICLGLYAWPAGAADWPTFHLDNARTGCAAESLTGQPLSVVWSVQLDRESVDASPAVLADRVIVGTAGGKLMALRLDDGARLWEFATGGAVVSSPAVGEGKVFAGSADRCVYALDLATGRLLWRFKTRQSVICPPLYEAGKVYFGSGDGVFRCVNATTGALVWQARLEGEISAGAALAEGKIYYGDQAGTVVARQAADGALLWTAHVSGGLISAPCAIGDYLIVPVMSPTALSPPTIPCVVVYRRSTGDVVWSLPRTSSVMHTPATDGHTVYFATVSGYLSDTELWACGLEDGKVMWRRKIGGVTDSSPLLAGGIVLQGAHDGNLYQVSVADGAVLQTTPLGPKIFSSPALHEGRIYVGSQDGRLYCLK
jgi:eukaryotic-like serine/threonine-protein kinase